MKKGARPHNNRDANVNATSKPLPFRTGARPTTETHSQKAKPTPKSKQNTNNEKEREAAFMSSLLADLDDEFWNAAPSSSPPRVVSPLRKTGGVGGAGFGRIYAPSFATKEDASLSNPKTKSSSTSSSSITTLFRIPTTPVKRSKLGLGSGQHPQHDNAMNDRSEGLPTSTSNSSTSSSSSSTVSIPSTPTLSTSTSATSTSTDFDLQAFLQGSEDWDLGNGELSPVKPELAIKIIDALAASPHFAGSRAHRETKIKQTKEKEEEMDAYTPDPCTRCVVSSVEDVCVDDGGGGSRKRWEKHIKALAQPRAANSNIDRTRSSPEKRKEKEKREVEVEIVLCDGWYETDIRVDDVVNVIGEFDPPLGPLFSSSSSKPIPATSAPTIRLAFTSSSSSSSNNPTNNSNNNLLILHPDVLLTATALSSAAQCTRKPVLSGLVRQSQTTTVIQSPMGGNAAAETGASPAMVYGNILHEVMDKCLVVDRWGGRGEGKKKDGDDKNEEGRKENRGRGESDEDDERWMNGCIDEAIRGSLGELVRLGLDEVEVRREIRERAKGFGVFARRYLGGVPKEDGILNNTRALAHDAPSKLAITHLLDIEEDIWSPAYGIKGKIDAVVRGIIDDPLPAQQGLYNSGLTRYTGGKASNSGSASARTQRHTPLPLELKTGRVQTGMDHRAQTMLYTLLLSERYNVDVRDGLLFYSRLRPSDTGYNGTMVGEDIVRVPRGWNEVRSLIGLRNVLAGYMWRRIRKRKGEEDGVVAADGDGENSQNRQLGIQIGKERERDIEEDFLPPPIDDEWTCKRCYALETCLLFRKTHPPSSSSVTTQAHAHSRQGIPAIPPPGRMRQLFEAHTAHLTPARVDFFRKWEALLALEERDMVRFKRELWVLGAAEREKRGRCLGGMRVVGGGVERPQSGGADADAEEDGDGDGDEGKWGKEGKIYRFVYTFEKDLEFNEDDDNVSLQNTQLVKGDPITISLMGPRQVLALARGYILDFRLVSPPPPLSSSPSSSVKSFWSSSSDTDADTDMDSDVSLDMGLGMDMGMDWDVPKNVKKTTKIPKPRERAIGRVLVGVDHSLQTWLDGGASGGTPLGVGLGAGVGRRPTFTSTSPALGGSNRNQGRYKNNSKAHRAIFRIDKDELFGGMSRMRENLANLFYASGPVVLPPVGVTSSANADAKGRTMTTTTTKMGKGNKKLLELVVDLREPVFDDDCGDDGAEVETDGKDANTPEARYLAFAHKPDRDGSEHTGSQNLDSQHLQTLNPAQRHAINRALSAKDYALILGMPGTGKTCVIAALVKELVFGSSDASIPSSTSRGSGASTFVHIRTSASSSSRSRRPTRRRPKTVLISSYTHSAVDSILRKLVEGGGWEGNKGERRIVRLGNIEKIHPEVRKFSPTFSSEENARKSKGKGREMKVEDLEEIYMNASVVATTCLGLDHPLFSRRRFDYCILDEASQITLPTCLGPLRFADVFVLVGDHYQLPPLVKNPLARLPLPTDSPITVQTLTSAPSLTTSLFPLLSTAHPNAVVELTEQYRMEEEIMTIANELVYGGRMRCGSASGGGLISQGQAQIGNGQEEEERRGDDDFLATVHRAGVSEVYEGMYKQCRGAEGGDDCWLERVCDDRTKAIFVNTDGLGSYTQESRVGDLVQNLGEAGLVAQFVETLRAKGVAGSRIGVVTLYRQQVKVLEGLLNGRDGDKGGDVEVMTADKSQGRDKDCVVVSLVRSNDVGKIGDLVKDWRRINVSFTRARFKLVIFGSRRTLEREPMLGRFFELMDRKGWVLDLVEGAERAHELVDELKLRGRKRRRVCAADDEEDEKGRTNSRCRKHEENGIMDVDGHGGEDDEDIFMTKDKAMGMKKTKADRPAKKVRLEDKPNALLKGRPVLRDLVGNEMCL